MESNDNKSALRRRLTEMAWSNLATVPPQLSLFQTLVTDSIPFAVIVTESNLLTKEFSVLATASVVDKAREQGLTCIPLNLTWRPRDQQALVSDLALMIFGEPCSALDVDAVRKHECSILRPFVIETLGDLDHKVALYANVKRTGMLTAQGVWQNSFRTATLNPEKLCAYLKRLFKPYALAEVGFCTGGIFSRVSWDKSGLTPGIYYGGKMFDYAYPIQAFQFGDFDCS